MRAPEVAVSRLSSDGGRASEERFSFEDLWIFGKMKRGDVQSLSLLDGDICRHVSWWWEVVNSMMSLLRYSIRLY